MLELVVALEELEKMGAEELLKEGIALAEEFKEKSEELLRKEALEEFAEAIGDVLGNPYSATGEALDALAKISVGHTDAPKKGVEEVYHAYKLGAGEVFYSPTPITIYLKGQ